MEPQIRASLQTSTFYYFIINVSILTICQLATMMVIVFGDISGKENVVAVSIIAPVLLNSFGIIRLLANMQLLVNEMDEKTASTEYGKEIQAIPFGILRFVFSGLFVIVAIVQLTNIY
mgnify:FL=1|jgi:hypothetical protein